MLAPGCAASEGSGGPSSLSSNGRVCYFTPVTKMCFFVSVNGLKLDLSSVTLLSFY